MGVGSATDGGNSGASGIGGNNDSGKSDGIGNNGSTVGKSDSVSANNPNPANDTLNESSQETQAFDKNPNQSLDTTHASRTGVSAAAARASVENAGIVKTESVKAAVVDAEFAEIDDRIYDGKLVGRDGQTFDPGTPLSEIDAVTPANGITNDRTVVHVNGIRTDLASQVESLQAIADLTGSRVIGIHNATAGTVRDLTQSLGDKLDLGNNPAVDSLADTIYAELTAGRQVDLMAHSQGAIITSRALTDVRNRLQLEDGMTRQQAEALLGNVRAETFGGASRRYPDGPQYVHYVNRNDFVPMAFGLRDFLNPFADAGRGAVTYYFNNTNNAHGFNDTYLPERVPFDQARRGIFN